MEALLAIHASYTAAFCTEELGMNKRNIVALSQSL